MWNGRANNTAEQPISLLTSEQYRSFGNSSYKWGREWNVSELTNTNFGIKLRGESNGTGFVDHFRIKVYYEEHHTWSSLSNMTDSDDSYATYAGNNQTVDLFNFNFPNLSQGNITVTGIEVQLEGYHDPGKYADVNVSLLWNGRANITVEQPINLQTSEQYHSTGNSSYTWGREWNVSDLTNANFGVRLRGESNGTGFVDFFRVKIYYEEYHTWSSPSNMTSSDNLYASYAGNNLTIALFNFSFPDLSQDNITVTGIEVQLEGYHDPSSYAGVNISLMWNDRTNITAEQPISFLESEQYHSIGNSSYTWGREWNVSDLTNTNFGIRLRGESNGTGFVDQFRIKIYYEEYHTWSSPSNMTLSDNSYATYTGNNVTVDLFNFNLQDLSQGNITVTGIEVQLEGYHDLGSYADINVSLLWNGLTNATAEQPVNLLSSEQYHYAGNSSYTWDRDWNVSDLTNANFGVRLRGESNGTGFVDHFRVKIYYEEHHTWSSPLNMTDSDDSYATYAGNNQTIALFNFNLPNLSQGNITVTGIEVQLEGYHDSGSYAGINVSLMWNGRTNATVEQPISFLSSEQYHYAGNSSYTWDRAWNLSDLTNANFGIKLRGESNGTGLVDSVQIKIYYDQYETWSSPSNMTLSDNSYASYAGNNQTVALFNFNFPDLSQGNITITGIEVQMEGYHDPGNYAGVNVSLMWNDRTNITAEQPISFLESEQYHSIGNSSYTWGREWNVSDLTNANFGVKLRGESNGTGFVDQFRIKFYYEEHHAWSSPSNMTLSDNSYATYAGNNQTVDLFNFNFPDLSEGNITITGIEVQLEGYHGPSSYADINISFLWNGRTNATVEQSISLLTSEQYHSIGNSSYKWDRAWNVTDFTNANFGVKLRGESNGTGRVDHFRVKIYYEEHHAWSSPSNMTLSDNIYSTYEGNNQTVDLFNFYLPDLSQDNITVTGIEVQLEGYHDLGSYAGVNVSLLWNGRDNITVEQPVSLQTSEQYHSIGNSSYTWGRDWNSSDLTNSNFGVRLRGESNGTGFVDNIQIKIYYEEYHGWSSPSNITLSDNSYASYAGNNQTVDLFNFNLPDLSQVNITITGVEIQLEGYHDSGSYAYINVSLLWNGLNNATVEQFISLQESEQYHSAGNSSYTWGREWNVSDLTNTNFGVRLRGESNGTGFVDLVRIKIYYDQYETWSSPSNMTVSDNSYASYAGNNLTVSLFNFNLPDLSQGNITINGIEIQLEGYHYPGSYAGVNVSLLWNGRTNITAEQSISLLASEQYHSIGNSSYTWGREWNVSDLTNANFGIRLRGESNDTGFVDHFRVKIYYEEHYAWSSPSNITISDDSYATYAGNNLTVELFNFNLPDFSQGNITITGIEVQLEGYHDLGSYADINVSLLWNGRINVTAEQSINLQASEQFHTIGNSSFKWDRVWNVSDLTNANFGISLRGESNGTGFVDLVQVKIYYEEDEYDFDREFSFTEVAIYDEELKLCIKTGQISNETLFVDAWNASSSSWTNIMNITDNDDDTWKNMSIRSYLNGTNLDIRIVDSELVNDSSNNTWQIDALFIGYKPISANFLFRENITIDHTKVSATLTNFPLLIDLHDTNLHDTNSVQSDGDDIIFTDPSGKKLAHQIEYFDQAGNGTHAHLVAWVSIPILSSTSDTLISMYYGNDTISNQENPTAVWDNDFTAVWHLNEDPTGSIYDSTINDHEGSSLGGMNSIDQVDGKIDGSIAFDGIDDRISINSINSNAWTAFTVEAWIRLDTTLGNKKEVKIVGKDGEQFELCVYRFSGYKVRIRIWTEGTGGGNIELDSSPFINTSDWHHIAFSWDSVTNDIVIYGDGSPRGISSIDGDNLADTSANTIIAALANGNDPFPGALSETRVSTIARSSSWILTEYNNQFDPDSFYTVSKRDYKKDVFPPELVDFGITDPGNGDPEFWADVSDDYSGVESVTIDINGTEYAMSLNSSDYWIYQPASLNFGDYFDYQIVNASDYDGKYMTEKSEIKNIKFDYDIVAPSVDDWEYYDNIGDFGTFNANVSDVWGIIDTVIVNVTDRGVTAVMRNTSAGYINDTLDMESGPISFIIIVNDTKGNNYTSSPHPGYVPDVNHVPSVDNLIFSPDPLHSNETLQLDYDFFDPDNDAEGGTEIRWYKNGVLQSIHDDKKTIAASYLFKGDEWNATVKPKDGKDFGVLVNSSTITVLNTAPEITSYSVSPSNPVTTSTMNCIYTYLDYDGDGENSANRETIWYKDGYLQPGLNDSLSVDSSLTTKGEEWFFRIRTHDGEDYSSWYQSTNTTILNTVPTVTYLNITNASNLRTTDDLVANWTFFDDDGDSQVVYYIRWYKNSLLQPSLNDTMIITSGNTSKDQSWSFKLIVNDGITNSSADWISAPSSPIVQILNSLPGASGLTITTTPYTTDDLEADWLFNDDDSGDTQVSYLVRWYKDGILQPSLNDSNIVSTSLTSKGEVWNYTVQVSDGDDYSIVYNSTSVTILNSLPTASGLTITSDPYNTTNLVASWTFADNDTGDSQVDFIIYWYRDGAPQSHLDNKTTVEAGNTTKSETWHYTLLIHDGQSWSVAYNSTSVTILNSIPTITGLNIENSGNLRTTDNLVANWTFSDDDVDLQVQFYIWWYKNGIIQPSLNNSKIVNAGNTTKDQAWKFELAVYDGEDNSSLVQLTSPVTILNTLPGASGLTITSTPYTTDDLEADWLFNDDDSEDTQVSYLVRWYKDAILQSSLNDFMTVSASLTSKGETWNYTLQVSDGDDYSIVYNSTIVTILNSLPTVSGLTITTDPHNTTNLVTGWTFTDSDTGDSQVDFIIYWNRDGAPQSQLDNKTTVEAGNTTKGEVWNYTLLVFDDESWSVAYNSNSTTILNSIPTTTDLSIENSVNLRTTDDLVANWTFRDDDGDSQVQFYIWWYKNGILQPSLNNSKIVNADNTTKDQTWKFALVVYDGEDNSSLVHLTSPVTILNTLPGASGLTITTTPYTTDDLVADWLFNDVDSGDTQVSYLVRWYKDGIPQPSLNDSTIVSTSLTSKGEIWNYTVQVSDGSDYSIVYNSTSVTILNSLPTASGLTITTDLYNITNLVASWTFADNDTGDSQVDFIIYWYRDGAPQSHLDNKTTVEAANTTKGE
ncbi:MAG: DUF2341 domain-containing protein, partial [Candidatus Hodarchaeales archaeon]